MAQKVTSATTLPTLTSPVLTNDNADIKTQQVIRLYLQGELSSLPLSCPVEDFDPQIGEAFKSIREGKYIDAARMWKELAKDPHLAHPKNNPVLWVNKVAYQFGIARISPYPNATCTKAIKLMDETRITALKTLEEHPLPNPADQAILYRRIQSIYERLVQNFPSNKEYAEVVALCQRNVVQIKEKNPPTELNLKEKEKQIQEAIELCKQNKIEDAKQLLISIISDLDKHSSLLTPELLIMHAHCKLLLVQIASQKPQYENSSFLPFVEQSITELDQAFRLLGEDIQAPMEKRKDLYLLLMKTYQATNDLYPGKIKEIQTKIANCKSKATELILILNTLKETNKIISENETMLKEVKRTKSENKDLQAYVKAINGLVTKVFWGIIYFTVIALITGLTTLIYRKLSIKKPVNL